MYGARRVKGEEYGEVDLSRFILEKVDLGMVDDLTKSFHKSCSKKHELVVEPSI